MSLAARIAVACLSLVLLTAALAAYQLTMIQRLEAANEELGQIRYTAAQITLEIQRRVEVLEQFTAKYFLLRDLAYAVELERLRDEVEAQLRELDALGLSAAEERAAEVLAARWRRYRRAALEEVAASEAVAAAGGADAGAPILAALEEVGRALEALLAASRRTVASQIAANARRVEKVVWASWAVAAAGLAVAALATLLIVRSVAVPLRRLARGTLELSSGDLSYRVTPAGSPELASLAVDFNAMAARLGELDRLKRDFVSHVSHDLKAPLASVEETIRLLLEGIPGPLGSEQERLLRLALRSARRLASLIANLLDLARLDAGALAYHFTDEDLVEVVRAAAQGIAALADEKRLGLSLDLPASPLPVRGDGPALLRVLDNLLANAVTFSPTGATLEVRVHRRGEPEASAEAGRWPAAAVVEIADRGPGVPDGDKERIFERFYQARPGGPGTGLGLAIARAVTEAHGGSLAVRDLPGGGSVFTLVLPAAEAEAAGETAGA